MTLVRGATLLDAARSAPTRSRPSSVGSAPPSSRRGCRHQTRSLARWERAAPVSVARPGPPDRQRQDAGRDVRRRRLERRGAALPARGGEAVAVTLELWPTPRTTPSRAAARPPRSRRRARSRTRSACRTSRSTFATSSAPAWSSRSSPHTRAGDTPNPCVGCNGHVRLDAMLEFADRLGCDDARDRPLRPRRRARPAGRCCAPRPTRPRTRPTCWRRSQPESLARMRFPLGEMTKPQVRAIAAEAGLPVATKADSQDLCFLAGHRPRALPARARRRRSTAGRDRRSRRRRRSAATAVTSCSPSASAAASA